MEPSRHKTARRVARLVVALAAGIATFVLLLVLFDEGDAKKPAPAELPRKAADGGK